MDPQEILEITEEITREAGEIVRHYFGEHHQITHKGEVNLVTEADHAVEEHVIKRLHQAFPTHNVLAEEQGGATLDNLGPLWIIDPLDGTNNFAHNFPHVGISLALWVDGAPLIGVIYDPLRDECFTARRGNGAARNGTPIRVTPTDQLAQALLATGFPYDRWTAEDDNTAHLAHFLRRSQGVRRAGAAVLDLAYVACGRFDGFWELRLSPWDIAAGVLIVEEAGGRVTDPKGASLQLEQGDIVASNGHIHEAMIRVLQQGAEAPRPKTDTA
jgi:myo-inositol-1(or 4)-monophosphatase